MVFQWIKRKLRLNRAENQGVLTDEAREKALEVRRMQHDVNQLRKEVALKKQIENMQKMLESGSSKNNPENIFMQILMAKMLSPQAPVQNHVVTTEQQTLNTSNARVLSDEEVLSIANMIKPYSLKYKDKIASLSDADILKIKEELIK